MLGEEGEIERLRAENTRLKHVLAEVRASNDNLRRRLAAVEALRDEWAAAFPNAYVHALSAALATDTPEVREELETGTKRLAPRSRQWPTATESTDTAEDEDDLPSIDEALRMGWPATESTDTDDDQEGGTDVRNAHAGILGWSLTDVDRFPRNTIVSHGVTSDDEPEKGDDG